jgi:hypothetical protein
VPFYESVFGCEIVPPIRDFPAPAVEAGTGVPGASLSGIHLRLRGHGPNGPTIEIFTYSDQPGRAATAANRPGFEQARWRRASSLDGCSCRPRNSRRGFLVPTFPTTGRDAFRCGPRASIGNGSSSSVGSTEIFSHTQRTGSESSTTIVAPARPTERNYSPAGRLRTRHIRSPSARLRTAIAGHRVRPSRHQELHHHTSEHA